MEGAGRCPSVTHSGPQVVKVFYRQLASGLHRSPKSSASSRHLVILGAELSALTWKEALKKTSDPSTLRLPLCRSKISSSPGELEATEKGEREEKGGSRSSLQTYRLKFSPYTCKDAPLSSPTSSATKKPP